MRRCSFLLVLCLSSAAAAFAQSAEISVSGGVSRFGSQSLGDSGGPINLTNGFRMAIRFTWNQGRFFSHEIGYGYAKTHVRFNNDPTSDVPVSMHQGLYDFLVNATPEGSRVRPFACGGLGFTSFFPPGSSAYYGNQVTKFGINYGGGIKFKLTQVWGLRFDFRQYAGPKPFNFPSQSGWLRQTEVTGGVAFMF